MKKLKFFFVTLIFNCTGLYLMAQNDGNRTVMADTMRDNGKIYVVIAVILTILIGLVLYVARLDKKISRLEKENK